MKNDMKTKEQKCQYNLYPLRCRQSPRVVTSAALWISPHLQHLQHRHADTQTQKNLPHSICFVDLHACLTPDLNCLSNNNGSIHIGRLSRLLHELVTMWHTPQRHGSIRSEYPNIFFFLECDAQMVSMSWADSYIR